MILLQNVCIWLLLIVILLYSMRYDEEERKYLRNFNRLTSRMFVLIPLSFRAEHLTVLIGKFIGKASLRFMICVRVVGVDVDTSIHLLRSSFVSSSKGTPSGAPSVFSHDISGGSFNNACWRVSSTCGWFCEVV